MFESAVCTISIGEADAGLKLQLGIPVAICVTMLPDCYVILRVVGAMGFHDGYLERTALDLQATPCGSHKLSCSPRFECGSQSLNNGVDQTSIFPCGAFLGVCVLKKRVGGVG